VIGGPRPDLFCVKRGYWRIENGLSTRKSSESSQARSCAFRITNIYDNLMQDG